MPQLSQNFENYPLTATLDGTGKATVAFQPNGSNVSVSRLFVNVSTSVKQATVTLYKGSISPTNAIGTIVSGSTGGLATGQIFLSDGTFLFVQWTGGDPGASATATFSGKQIPLAEMGSDSITWSDPIAASDGSLIFPAIKSPNYVTGISGWTINRDGTFELSGGTFRGDVAVNGPDGSQIRLDSNGGVANVSILPPAFTTISKTIVPGGIVGSTLDDPLLGTNLLKISAPFPAGTGFANDITMTSRSIDGTSRAVTFIDAEVTSIFGDAVVNGVFTAANRVTGNVSITPSAANVPTSIAVLFPAQLKGTTFTCQVTANTQVPVTNVTGCSYSSLSKTGVTLWVVRTNTTATTLSYTVEGF